MEFEEMQKIWDEQKGETMYAINESALHKSVTRKKDAASRRINKVEVSLMIINGLCTILLFVDALDDPHNWDFFGSAIMLCTVLYIAFTRHKRRKEERTFNRNMIGELDHAIANTNSIIQISRMMIIGYLIPISVFYFSKMASLGASKEKWMLMIGLYVLAFILIVWERKKIHLPRKDSLLSLKKKLIED